jgi:Domain of unknown function (DUF6602)
MSEQTNAASAAQEVKKSWGFGTASVSSEIQAAAAQIIADSRLPGSNLGTLLNSFLNRYLPWPFRATSGVAVDTAGAESKQFGSLIYTSTQDLARVPADALACAIDVHETLGLEELRASYEKISQVKELAKTPIPKTTPKTPVAEVTMGIILAVDSNVPLEKIGEELEHLNKQHSHHHWVDAVVVLSRGTVSYACQFPHQPLGDFLPPARDGIMLAAMYVHIFARPHAAFSLNRMCSLLFPYLYFFSPGTGMPPYKELLEGAPQTGMTISPYQVNLKGQLVPVPQELRFNQFFLFPLGFRVEDDGGNELARVQYLPWQDGGVVRVIGKMPIEMFLVFAGKEAVSQPVVRLNGEQYSGVIPLSRSQFVEMAERTARQSRNMYVKPDQRPKWTVEKRGDEGTSSPFVARVWLGICHMRDQALLDPKVREEFDVAFEAVITGLETVRTAAAEAVKLYREHERRVASGEISRIENGVTYINGSIDRELRKLTDEVISTASRVMKDRMQAVLRVLKIDIGFLYQKQNGFNNGSAKLKLTDPDLADYVTKTRSKWSERLTNCRTGLEHGTWVLPKVKHETHGTTIKAIEPMVDGQPVTEFVAHVSDRLICFVEDMIAHGLQTQMPQGISISEIPLAERPPEIVERFRPALVGGGMPIWKIFCHDSKFEDH